MTSEMTSQTLSSATLQPSRSAEPSRPGDSRFYANPNRRTLQKNPPTSVSTSQSRFPSISSQRSVEPNAESTTTTTKRRKSIRERSSTFGSRGTENHRRTPLADSSTAQQMPLIDQNDDQTLPDNSAFPTPVNFDDFHNSIVPKEPSLSHFPYPGQVIAGYGTAPSPPKPAPRWSTTPSVSNTKAPRSSILGRRPSNASRNPIDERRIGAQGSMAPPPAPPIGRPRRQSHVTQPCPSIITARPPRKSIVPGISTSSPSTDDNLPQRRPSLSKRNTSTDTRVSSSSLRASQQPSSSNPSFLNTTRSQKAKSLQPSARTNRDNLHTPSGASDHSQSSSTTTARTPGKGTTGRTTTPSSSRRASMMPHHATGLGARTISPTDARRMKRMSLIPHPPPIPQPSPAQQVELNHSRPRSSAHSPPPSMIPRKSVTPSSARTTPDPHRKSYSSGISLSSNTSYNSARNSSGSLQGRPSQTLSTSRLPTPKTRMDQSGHEEEEVPPVPAIPKAYESPKAETDAGHFKPMFAPRKSSLPLDTPTKTEPTKHHVIVDKASGTVNQDILGTPKPHTINRTFHSEMKIRPNIHIGKKNLQPLKLPPLNLMPLSGPVANKIDALRDRDSNGVVLRFANTPPPRQGPAKTPSTPMTASKASFFPNSVYEMGLPPPGPSRSNSSQFGLPNPSGFRVQNSSSALDLMEMPSTRNFSPYLSSSLPKNDNGPNYVHDNFSKPTTQRLTGPRPQTQISSISISGNVGIKYHYEEAEIPPSPQSKVSLDQDRNTWRADLDLKLSTDMSKFDNMPPPKLPASATTTNLSRVSPISKSAFITSRRKPSVSSSTSAAPSLRKKSVSSDQSISLVPTPSTDSGEAELHPARSSSSILSPVHRLLGGTRSSPTPKSPRPEDADLDRDDLSAEEEMRKLGSKRKDFEAAAKELDELRRRASPKERATPAQALKVATLNIFERGEIIDYKEIYFCGTHKAKKHVGDLNSQSANFGYDDERGDYNIVIGDHIAYRYEIVDVLGKGSFGQVVRCVDHKTGVLVAVKIIRNKKRFHQQALVEVNILQKLKEWDPQSRHSVVNFTQSFYFRGHLCISTELLGINLYEFIKAHDFRGFSLKIIRRFTKQMLSTLVLLHAHRVIHCDMKPENVLLVHPLRGEIKVIDFGSSCFENEKVYTYIQSRFYRSPEVILGMSYGMPIDIWSLGCILAELYTGYPLFPGENEQEQLACIMEVFGPPEKHLIEKSTRKKLFFDSSGKPRLTVSSKGRRRKPSSKDLRHALKCDNPAFLDFISRCLRWDPARRLSPRDALQHEFITGVKPPPPRSSRSAAAGMRDSPAKRSTSTATSTNGRPLPEPPSSLKTEGSRSRGPPSHSPVKYGGPKRHSTFHSISTGVGTKRSSNGTSATGSTLPRVAPRSTSGKPDLAAAAAATSLISSQQCNNSAPMNGFAEHGLDEDKFGEQQGIAAKLRTFDAFPKTKPTYTSTSRGGGQWTLFIILFCTALSCSELLSWYRGQENHHFGVERGVSRDLQFNLDIVVTMPCDDVRVNIQDAAGDHISTADLLTREPTSWAAWQRHIGEHNYQTLNKEDATRLEEQEEDLHVEHVLGEVRRSRKRKFPKGPKVKSSDTVDSCRLYGSMEGNKVHGDLHITARGHGYFEWGEPVDPRAVNFTHMITELSFGPHYSSLLNPLDKTISTTSDPFFKYQYYLSVVPTIYSKAGTIDPNSEYLPDPTSITSKDSKTMIFTNQYAVTSHSRTLDQRVFVVPGIFFKYNIEPILLIVSQERGSLLALLVRLVNVMSGVLVAGGWLFKLATWTGEIIGKRNLMKSEGLLTGKHAIE
ncbi:hypothetical protein FQN57_006285 [Myotisia sp. PD_48]|nr:hypothetical protein FQN57_006285 [Myotisia sp. PD_48]